jgi:uncharacterized membrane protein
VVAPSHEDPLVRGASAAVGGPLGGHATTGWSWWTPLRVVLVLTTVTFALGMVQKAPCVVDGASLTSMCYTDIDKLYSSRGFAEGNPPYVSSDERYQYFEYPVLVGGFVQVASLVTHEFFGSPDVADLPPDRVFADPEVAANVVPFTTVNALLLFVCALVAAAALTGVHRQRPWDAALFAAAPALALTGLINWDLFAVAILAAALLAWSRRHPVVAGVLIGLGTAAKLYPLFILGPLLVLCWRAGRMAAYAQAAGAAAVAWLLVNLPVLALNPAGWGSFWAFNSERGADLGSVWYVWTLLGREVSASTINTSSWVFFGAACVAVALLALLARRRPRLPQLAFLVVAAFLLVNKVYSPQYVLWLLPLAVLARPRWRDLLVWQACEAFYFGAIWLHLGGDLDPGTSGAVPSAYVLAVAVRLAGQMWLMGVVVRDVLRPWHDPVRADGRTDDPAGGVLDAAPDRTDSLAPR